MKLPVIRGIIDRRMLINFRVQHEQLARLLPQPFRPIRMGEYGIAGICLNRLKQLHLPGLPAVPRLVTENAAHRIAIEWDTPQGVKQGVYIPRRDTNSRLATWFGGRGFPRVHHHARFDVKETETAFLFSMQSEDLHAHIRMRATVGRELGKSSCFANLEQASRFFESGSPGYSPARGGKAFEGLFLKTKSWTVEPLEIEFVESGFFNDREKFPAGSVQFDCALLMRNIPHEWHAAVSEPRLCGCEG